MNENSSKEPSLIYKIATNNFTVVLLSTLLTAALVIGIYEITQNVKYYKWRAEYDNSGWIGKITIPSDDHNMMWEYSPYSTIEQISTNRFGFRDIDYQTKDKPDHIYRIAFVGDSVTLGLKVDFDNIFTRQFENKANAHFQSKTIQAMNFGIDGYNTPQVLAMIKSRVLEYSPDQVVYVMCLNDFDFTSSAGEKLRYFKKPTSFLWKNIEQYKEKNSNQEFHVYKFSKNKDKVFDSIYKMADVLNENGIKLQVVVLPVFGGGGFTNNYPLNGVHREITETLSAKNISVIDLLGDFAREGKDYTYFALDIWHPNDTGHEFIADRMLTPVLAEFERAGFGGNNQDIADQEN